jgi:hypothetical protein
VSFKVLQGALLHLWCCSCRCGVGATYSDKRKMKKHFRIVLGVGSARKSSPHTPSRF